MKVLLYYPALIPPRDYGGTERAAWWLAEGLRDRGHTVALGALEGSRPPEGVELWPIPGGTRDPEFLLSHRPDGFDLVHLFTPPRKELWDRFDFPWLLRLAGNGKPGEEFPPNTVFLSQDHARRHGRTAYVHNGLDPSEFEFNPRPRGEAPAALFLSRTHWSAKNLKGAMALCRKARLPLTIAGGNRPLHLRLLALLAGQSWAGPVAGAPKARLLADAKVLVFPILWSEPFGIVMLESLVSGTPVVASALGSIPEVLTPEVGRVLPIPKDPQAIERWVETLVEIREGRTKWDPAACRARVEAHFTHHKMAENWEGVYRRLLSTGRV